MPEPRKGESKSEYISRAIEYMVKNEGLSQKHAVGKAEGMWASRKKKSHHKRRTILHD